VLWVSVDDLSTIDVAHVVVQNVLFEKIYQCLDSFGHLLWLNDLLVVILLQARKIEVWICLFKALDVESMLEENSNICELLGLSQVPPYLVTEGKDCFNDLFLVIVIFTVIFELIVLVIITHELTFVLSLLGSVV
jgi:hypothetical protein